MSGATIEGFLAELELALASLSRRERRRAVREARDHLLCAAAERQADGRSRSEAVRGAIDAFGAVAAIAASYRRPRRSGGAIATASGLVGVVVLAALTILPTGGGLGQVFISTSHAAESGCAGRWNAEPPSSLYRRAWVSSPGSRCDVVLHDAARAVVFQQDARGGTWYTIHPPGQASWSLGALPRRYRALEYSVVGAGRIDARLGDLNG